MRPFNLPISNSFVILSEALFSGVEGPAFPRSAINLEAAGFNSETCQTADSYFPTTGKINPPRRASQQLSRWASPAGLCCTSFFAGRTRSDLREFIFADD
jgi:hypothetical protein